MKANVTWKEGMLFDGEADGRVLPMDAKAPLGRSAGFTPKELVALGVAGCTAMDVVALLRKHKQVVTAFSVGADVVPTKTHPIAFESVEITYHLTGEIESEKAIEAVRLSQTKYCGVSFIVSRSAVLNYRIVLNGAEIGTGQADFDVP